VRVNAVMFKLCKVCRDEKPGVAFYEKKPGYLKSTCMVCDGRRLGAGSRQLSGCKTYAEIALEMKIPVWEVERIERKALVKLRRMMSGWA
jgi:hypothetical protein